MAQCPRCGGKNLKEAAAEQSFRVGVVQFKTEVTGWQCARCGELRVDPGSMRRAELLAARWLAERGAQDGESFRFMRKAVGLRAAELAALLGVQPETLSRWETGKREVTRCAAAILGSIVCDTARGRSSLIGRLRALQMPLPADGSPVRLS